ncbi:MAG: hypothetical protein U1E70_25900 [Acetobacteraceae bacterium]
MIALREAGWSVEIDESFPLQVVSADSTIDAELIEGPASIGWNCISVSW